MTIPTPRFTSEDVEAELGLTPPYSSATVGFIVTGHTWFTSAALAGWRDWDFQWDAPTTIGYSGIGPGVRGSGLILNPNGHIQFYYYGSDLGILGRWVTKSSDDTVGAHYQVQWRLMSGAVAGHSAGWSENAWLSIESRREIIIDTSNDNTKTATATFDLRFRETGASAIDFTQRITLSLAVMR